MASAAVSTEPAIGPLVAEEDLRALALAHLSIAFMLVRPATKLPEQHQRTEMAHASLLTDILGLLAAPAARPAPGQQALPVPQALPDPLTDSEIRILRYLPTHLTAREIASELHLSAHTVTTHMRHLYAKLGAHRRHDAVDRARALGLLSAA